MTPDVPVRPRVVATTDTSVTLRWDQNLDGITTAYHIYRNASAEDFHLPSLFARSVDHGDETMEARIDGLIAGTNYRFAISAISSFGNGSARCRPVSVRTLARPAIDTVVLFPAPIPLGQRSMTMEVAVSDSDGDATIKLVMADLTALGGGEHTALYDDGEAPDRVGGDGVYTCSVSLPALSTGAYTILLHAQDYSGLQSKRSVPIEVVDPAAIANHAPRIVSTQPAVKRVRLGQGEAIRFNITATDPDGDPLRLRWFVDATLVAVGRGYETNFSVNGSYTVRVCVLDTANGSVEREWTVLVGAASGNETPNGEPAGEDESAVTDTAWLLWLFVVFIGFGGGATLLMVLFFYRAHARAGDGEVADEVEAELVHDPAAFSERDERR